VIEPDSWSLLEPIEAFLELKDLSWIREASWHFNKDALALLLLRGHLIKVRGLIDVGMSEGRAEVGLPS